MRSFTYHFGAQENLLEKRKILGKDYPLSGAYNHKSQTLKLNDSKTQTTEMLELLKKHPLKKKISILETSIFLNIQTYGVGK